MLNLFFNNFDLIVLLIGVGTYYYLTTHFKILDPKASVLACSFGIIIYLAGGLHWLIPLLYFFTSSSILSLSGKKLKQRFKFVFDKPSTRDSMQVFANGFASLVFSISEIIFSNHLNYILFLSALAAVNADTWATEIGTFSKYNPRLILNLIPVEKGRSGAISILGLTTSLLGSCTIVVLGVVLYHFEFSNNSIVILLFSGLFASLVDSLLGATIQAQYFDDESKKQTERSHNSSGNPNRIINGFTFINNDLVYLIASFSAPLFYIIISHSLSCLK